MAARSQGSSVTTESDEVKEMFCECCDKVKNTTVPAEGFCADCYEYMCATCIHYHQIYKDGHTIKNKDNMPEDFCVDKCALHPREIVKFYCKTCSKPVCCTCKTSYHKECADITFIPTLVHSTDIHGEVEHFKEKMACLANDLQNTKDKIDFNFEDVSNIRKNTISAMEECMEENKIHFKHERNNIIKVLDKKREEMLKKLQKEMAEKLQHFDQQQVLIMTKFEEIKDQLSKEIETFQKTDQSKLQSLSCQTKTMRRDLLTLQQNINRKMTTGDKCGLFIAIKNASEKSTKLKSDTEKVNGEICIKQYGFVANKECVKINTDICTVTFGKLMDKSKVRRKISIIYNIDITTEPKNDRCQILSIRRLTDSRIVASVDRSYYSNLHNPDRLALIDTETRKVINEITLSTTALVIAVITDDHLAVSLIKKHTVADTCISIVQIFQVSKHDQLTLKKEFELYGRCKGLVSCNSNLISLFPDTGEVKTLDMEGHILNTFKLEEMSSTGCIAISPDLKTLHIALGETIYNNDFQGNIISKNSKLKKYSRLVTDMVTDRSGAIFIASLKGVDDYCMGFIDQFSADITTDYQLLFTDLIYGHPYTMCYCDRKERLYVNSFAFPNQGILVFDVS